MAWQQIPRYNDPFELYEPYECNLVCRRGDIFDYGKRKNYRCTRYDLPEVEWDLTLRSHTPHMGREKLYKLSRERNYYGRDFNWELPPEDPTEGCPGGWYRSPFAISLYRYLRTPLVGGGWTSNGFYDQADDLIKAAVHYYELAYVRGRNYAIERQNDYRKSQAKAAK